MAADHKLIADDVREEIVKWYLDGRKLREIEAHFDVPRATIYWILERDGHAPNRTQRGRRMVGGDQALAQLYQVIGRQEAYIQQLEDLLEEHDIDLPSA